MSRPTIDDLRKQVAGIEEAERREELRVIGAAVVAAYDPYLMADICAFCDGAVDDHEGDCPSGLIEAYVEEHGRPAASEAT